jgi:glutaconate CoA-transferase subunit A
VEEIVEEIPPAMNAIVLPHWIVSAVVHCPGGAYPSYAHGLYERDNSFYQRWDAIARDRDGFRAWMERHVLTRVDHRDHLLSFTGKGDSSHCDA